MTRSSRRAFVAAAGGVLSAGCLAAPGRREPSDSETEYSFEGPDPLGFEAVPEDVADPPSFDGTQVYESDVARGIIDVVDRQSGWTTLVYGRSQDGFESPELRELSPDGEMVSSRTLDAVPSNRVWHLEQPGERLVVGGQREQDDREASWFRGVDSEFAFDTDWRTIYADVAVDGDSLLGAGTLEGNSEELGAICHRIGPDGSITWEQTVEDTGPDTQFWSVTTTHEGVLAGGLNAGDVWLVSYADGEESWRRTITHGEEAYIVEHLAAGQTGTYAVAQTNQFATGNNHLLLLSLGGEGSVEWARVFDPNFEEYTEGPMELYGQGIVDAGGPVLVGTTSDRVWLAATEPDGTMRWAGYYPESRGDRVVRSLGLATADEQLSLYGSTGTHQEETPWIARLHP